MFDMHLSDDTLRRLALKRPAQVYYVHSYYGCDSGCCGHTLFVVDAEGEVLAEEFDFTHDREAIEENVRRVADRLQIPIGACEFSDWC